MSPYLSKLAPYTNVSMSKWSAVVSYKIQFNSLILRETGSKLSDPDHKKVRLYLDFRHSQWSTTEGPAEIFLIICTSNCWVI